MKVKLSWTNSFSTLFIKKRFVKNILYSESGNLSTAMVGYVPLYIMSGFSAGMITALNYGRQVADLLNVLFTNQICSVSGIKLNELFAKGEIKLFKSTFIKSSELIIFLLLPLSFIIAIYSQEILSVLFKRGAFDETSVLHSSLFLKYFAMSTSLIGIDLIATRAILASQKLKYAFWNQIITNVIQIVSLFALKPFVYELSIPLSFLIKYSVNFFSLWLLFKFIVPELNYLQIIAIFFKWLFINVLVSTIVVLIVREISFKEPLVILSLVIVIYCSLLCTITIYFKLNEEISNIIRKIWGILTFSCRNGN